MPEPVTTIRDARRWTDVLDVAGLTRITPNAIVVSIRPAGSSADGE